MAQDPPFRKPVRAELIELDEIVLSDLGFWYKLVDQDIKAGSVVWTGEEIHTGKRALLWANVNDERIVGFYE